jgi:hypothetical protein
VGSIPVVQYLPNTHNYTPTQAPTDSNRNPDSYTTESKTRHYLIRCLPVIPMRIFTLSEHPSQTLAQPLPPICSLNMLNVEDIELRHPRSQSIRLSLSFSHLLVSEVIQQHPEMHFEDEVGQLVHGARACPR